MSSVASKQALLLALGGVSIAALFVWYIQKQKRDEERKKRKLEELNNVAKPATESSSTAPTAATSTKKSRRNKRNSDSLSESNGHVANGNVIHETQKQEDVVIEASNEEKTQNEKPLEVVAETSAAEIEVERKADENKEAEIEGVLPEAEQKIEEEIEAAVEEKTVEILNGTEQEETVGKKEQEELEVEETVQKVEVKKTQAAAPPAPIQMPNKRRTVESEQIPEEPTPTKLLDKPLTLEIIAQMSPASWSEEMENCNEEFVVDQSSDMEPSPISPTRRTLKNKKDNKARKSARGSSSTSQSIKRNSQRRLNNNARADEHEKENQQQQQQQKSRRGSAYESAGDACKQPANESAEQVGYDNSESPGLVSQNSEASSQDSGRATGGLASSLSPVDDQNAPMVDEFGELLPMYEFEIPNSLVGLVIGIKGKTIKELSQRTNVRMLIRQHHTPEKVKTHQICQVRGKRDEINHCLQMLRRRFPSPRFPELNLQPILPPPIPSNNFDMLSTQPTWLALPEEVECEIAVSSIIDVSHFFVQQPTHPSFASLRYLDQYMMRLYGEQQNLPELPIPCQNGLLCAAPVGNNWFRAVTVQYYDETDEVFVKFVDYGGYSRMARKDLRQIRTDLMSLPFQSTEIMLAHVRPVDGTSNWSQDAMKEFTQLCTGRVISCKLVGYAVETKIPMVELLIGVKDGNGDDLIIRFDQHLMKLGLARAADPSKMARTAISAMVIGPKRPSLSTQHSQSTVVCN